MITSRNIMDLHPKVRDMAADFLRRCEILGLHVIITCTYRDFYAQDALYAIGRTVKGEKVSVKRPMGYTVTKARGGYSYHNYRLAFDIVVLRHGKVIWDTSGDGLDNNPADDETDNLELWQKVGKVGKEAGLEWAGDWVSFREFPHFQYTGGLTIDDLRAGKQLQ